MPQHAIEIDHHGQAIRGTAYRPAGSSGGSRTRCAILLHGFTGSRVEAGFLFVKLGRALAARGIAAITFDFLHSGESDGAFEEMLPSGELADVMRVWQWAQAQPWIDRTRVGLVGYSLGGMLAACASGGLPELRALALIAPTTARNLCRRSGDPDTCVPARQPVVVGPHTLHPRFFDDLRALAPQTFTGLVRHPRPTLVVQGMGDTAVPPAVSQEFIEALERARVPVRVHQIPEAEHTFIRLAWQKSLIDAVVGWMGEKL